MGFPELRLRIEFRPWPLPPLFLGSLRNCLPIVLGQSRDQEALRLWPVIVVQGKHTHVLFADIGIELTEQHGQVFWPARVRKSSPEGARQIELSFHGMRNTWYAATNPNAGSFERQS